MLRLPWFVRSAAGARNKLSDPGEVRALTLTDGQEALVIGARHLRSLCRLPNKTLRKFQKAISRTHKGSNRRRKLLSAKYRFLNWIGDQISHAEHAITKMAVDWCLQRGAKKVYIGDPQGVKEQDSGRHHNQRMSQWSFGRLLDLQNGRHNLVIFLKA